MIEINFTIVLQAANFLILVLILKKVFWQPMMRHIDRRDALIADRKAKTESLSSEASEMQQQHEQRIRAAKKEGMSLRDRLVTEGRTKRTELIDEAVDQAERVVSEGERKVRNQMQTALDGITDEEIENLADLVVSRLMGRSRRA